MDCESDDHACIFCGDPLCPDDQGVMCGACYLDDGRALPATPADLVLIFNDNPDFDGPNNGIECSGDWTDYKPRAFWGESLLDCLMQAVKAMRERCKR